MVNQISRLLFLAIQAAFGQEAEIEIEKNKDIRLGDFSCNIALRLSKTLKRPPMEIATQIIAKINDDRFQFAVAAPGFINIVLAPATVDRLLDTIIKEDQDYGRFPSNGKTINIEYVSANPTGPLHLGHARQAALGDCISRMYASAGYHVTREFYLNDCGNQVQVLGNSLYARYQQLFQEWAMPEEAYLGQDVVEIAKEIKEQYGDIYLNNYDAAFFIEYGITRQRKRIEADLALFRSQFDVYSSEKAIRASGKIDAILTELKERGATYEKDGALWLRTSEHGDDKDRVLIKQGGSYTYLLPDIAYHINKLDRGFDSLLDLFGADHHGYLARMRAALTLLGHQADRLNFLIVQMVRMIKGDVEIKFSKRSGQAITLNDLIEEVGVDAARYIFASRAANSHLDIDVDLLTKQSSDNPVYYVQYAHARICSAIELAEKFLITDCAPSLDLVPEERELVALIAIYPKMVLEAALTHAPHKITGFLQNIAQSFHSFYTSCKICNVEEREVSGFRLKLIRSTRILLRNSLLLLGVSAPEKM